MDTRSRQLFQDLTRLVAEPLLLVSLDAVVPPRVLLSSPAAQVLLGCDAAALADRPLEALLDPTAAADAHAYLRMCARSVQPLPGALQLRHVSGARVACRVKGARLLPAQEAVSPPHVLLRLEPREGSTSPFVLLNEKIAHLTREVVSRKRAEQEALEALRVRDEFLSVASHELKTPLHAFKLQLELVTRAVAQEPGMAERLEGRLEVMRRQLARLVTLGESLLDVSQLHAGALQLQLQPVDLAEAAHASVERMGPELQRAGCSVQLQVQAGTVALADPSRLDQVLVNLLSNAAKYGAGQPVRVVSHVAPRWAGVSVRDEGVGIAEADQRRIFGRFERAAATRHFGGLGLGLYVSRQLAEAMGGSLHVASEAGAGATFTLHLPRVAPPPHAHPA